MPQDISPAQERVTVKIGLAAKQALNNLATRRSAGGKVVYEADLVREAIDSLLATEGFSERTQVDRGGYRHVDKEGS